MKRSRPEQEIQRRVFEHLRFRGEAGVFAFHVPNGGKRALLEAVQFKKAGVVAGVPDVIAIKDGVTHALELKASKARKPSDAQIETIKKMETAGVRVAVAHSLDDRAVEAATKVEKKTAVCTDQNGYWDVLSQRCILEDQK